MYFEQWKPVFHMLLNLSSVETLTLLIKSLIDPNLNPFSHAWNKEMLFFSHTF